jgi:signal transduction histidine kinase
MTDEKLESQSNTDVIIENKVIEIMGHISSELAHDLRSPLQTIQNAVYLIQKNPENEMFYGMVKQSLSQVTSILDSFRDYYKAHMLSKLETDPAKVIELAFSELEIPDTIKVTKDLSQVKHIFLDPSKVALAIRNLLKNAIDAMPEGGELSVKVFGEGDSVVFTIQDTGIGISSEIVETIYTPFLANQKRGKGLGIPTSKRIIESHGGEISFTSKQGEDTLFTIRLPRSTVNL